MGRFEISKNQNILGSELRTFYQLSGLCVTYGAVSNAYFQTLFATGVGLAGVLSLACRGFETHCNDFFTFALASIGEILT